MECIKLNLIYFYITAKPGGAVVVLSVLVVNTVFILIAAKADQGAGHVDLLHVVLTQMD